MVATVYDVWQHPLDAERLRGSHIEAPHPGQQLGTYALVISGWVVGASSPVVAVEIVYEKAALWSTSAIANRPDIAAAHPDAPHAARSGFRITLNLLNTTPKAMLLVQAVLMDQSRVPLANITVQRQPLPVDFEPKIQPLLLTTLGRSGSSWLVLLLAQHPQIAVYRPFKYEPRVAQYWFDILRALSEPASYLSAIGPDLVGDRWWLGGGRSRPLPPEPEEEEIQTYLGRVSVEELVVTCQRRIEGFYEQVAGLRDQNSPMYFAEKFWPDYHVPALLWELYTGTREIFLVRDFRDTVCSIFSFNEKRGDASFNQGEANSAQEYIHKFRHSAVRLLESWRQRSDRAHLLRYEDLIERPQEVLASMLAYLDLDASDSIVQRMLGGAAEVLPAAQRMHQTSSDPAASIGRWRRDLDSSLQEVCEEAFGDVLEEFGYAEAPVVNA